MSRTRRRSRASRRRSRASRRRSRTSLRRRSRSPRSHRRKYRSTTLFTPVQNTETRVTVRLDPDMPYGESTFRMFISDHHKPELEFAITNVTDVATQDLLTASGYELETENVYVLKPNKIRRLSPDEWISVERNKNVKFEPNSIVFGLYDGSSPVHIVAVETIDDVSELYNFVGDGSDDQKRSLIEGVLSNLEMDRFWVVDDADILASVPDTYTRDTAPTDIPQRFATLPNVVRIYTTPPPAVPRTSPATFHVFVLDAVNESRDQNLAQMEECFTKPEWIQKGCKVEIHRDVRNASELLRSDLGNDEKHVVFIVAHGGPVGGSDTYHISDDTVGASVDANRLHETFERWSTNKNVMIVLLTCYSWKFVEFAEDQHSSYIVICPFQWDKLGAAVSMVFQDICITFNTFLELGTQGAETCRFTMIDGVRYLAGDLLLAELQLITTQRLTIKIAETYSIGRERGYANAYAEDINNLVNEHIEKFKQGMVNKSVSEIMRDWKNYIVPMVSQIPDRLRTTRPFYVQMRQAVYENMPTILRDELESIQFSHSKNYHLTSKTYLPCFAFPNGHRYFSTTCLQDFLFGSN